MSVRYAVDSDGDAEMSIHQPIVEVIRPPELSGWLHAALIEWHREWERHRCSTTGETFENVMTTVKSSVKPKMLRNMATYVLKKPVASMTDADIMGAVRRDAARSRMRLYPMSRLFFASSSKWIYQSMIVM
ncbi:hypothetical protein V7S43_011383 [Phytophthora oleae]|uniref:Uncharacterized protein n=1 Tax=Phytophthora oleae TaxID=2107226 RepID=A0ABD3F9E7_9STRA